MINGVINVYKEKGYTSHDVVAKLRGILHQKKIGHTGTLDPEAEGVLPVCLGRGTKLCAMLTDKRKTYEAVLYLGRETDTQDMTGTCIREYPVEVTPEEVRSCILSFLGEQMQIPPMYSALKVQGKKLYELAREGIEVERQPRKVVFYQIDVLSMDLPRVSFRVTCSKGTYIRTLCHDIGSRLGCGGCMESLKRTQVDRFAVRDSRTLAQLESLAREGRISEAVVSVEEMFSQCPAVRKAEAFDKMLKNGNPVPAQGEILEGKVRMYNSTGVFIGIYEFRREKNMYCPAAIFCTPEDFAGKTKETT